MTWRQIWAALGASLAVAAALAIDGDAPCIATTLIVMAGVGVVGVASAPFFVNRLTRG